MGKIARELALGVTRLVPKRARQQIGQRLGLTAPPEDPDNHPEKLAIEPYVVGRCLEIGCGHRKTKPDNICVDLIPRGSRGKYGNVAGQISVADVAGDGTQLPFTSEAFDSIVARHNLEHYVDVLATLEEWKRVLCRDGTLAVIVPDEESYPGRTLELDPTHYHGFTQSSLTRLMQAAGFRMVFTSVVSPNWSFLLVSKKVSPSGSL